MEFSFTSYKNNFLDLYHLKLQQSVYESVYEQPCRRPRSLTPPFSFSLLCLLLETADAAAVAPGRFTRGFS